MTPKSTLRTRRAEGVRVAITQWAERFTSGGCGVYGDGTVNVYINYDSDKGCWQPDIWLDLNQFNGLSPEQMIELVETEVAIHRIKEAGA